MCPSETRWFRNETHTVNGLTAYKLNLAKIGTGVDRTLMQSSPILPYAVGVGIRVWIRKEDGTEIELTDGTPKAIAFVGLPYPMATESRTWDCPETELENTDAVVVRVYGRILGDWSLLEEFITEQLNAVSLLGATWTVYYTLEATYRYLGYTYYIYLRFYFDGNYQSRIENFTYSTGAVTHQIARFGTNIMIRPHAIVLIKRNDEIVGYRKPHAPFRPERPIQPEIG